MRFLGGLLTEEAGGIVIGEARDGEQAVALVLEHEPDVVLMDYHMPTLDGIEATARIKALRPEIVVVAWTSSEDSEVARRFVAAGAEATLTKADLDGLRAVLRAKFA